MRPERGGIISRSDKYICRLAVLLYSRRLMLQAYVCLSRTCVLPKVNGAGASRVAAREMPYPVH